MFEAMFLGFDFVFVGALLLFYIIMCLILLILFKLYFI